MITNADITIYNRIPGIGAEPDIWKRNVVENVSFYSDTKTNLDTNGLVTADVYKIRIPQKSCGGYVAPESYNGADGTWTVRNDDYIVRGRSDQDIERPAELEKGIRINSWSDNRRGVTPHIRIGGF